MADYHVGESLDPRMRRLAPEFGLNYDRRTRQFSQADFDRFGLIIPMDFNDRADMLTLTCDRQDEKKIITLRTFDPQGESSDGISDRCYSGVEGFHNTFKIVERSCRDFLNALEASGVDFYAIYSCNVKTISSKVVDWIEENSFGEIESSRPVAGGCINIGIQ